MPYPAFTAEDFCKNPDFIRWVLTPTHESNRFWQTFVADYPHKAADVQIAIGYVRTIHFREIDPSEKDLARLKQRIWADIEPEPLWNRSGEPAGPSLAFRPRRTGPVLVEWYQRPYWAAAAVVLLVASLSAGWWAYRANADLTYETAYGKIREIRLADGSVVTLNAHSSLKVAHNLSDNPIREVWLDGEAYFDSIC